MLSDKDQWASCTRDVDRLLSRRFGTLAVAARLLGGLHYDMSLLEVYIRSVLALYNPAKLMKPGAAGSALGPPPTQGLPSLIVHGYRTSSDVVFNILWKYEGQEQLLLDELRDKYKLTYGVRLVEQELEVPDYLQRLRQEKRPSSSVVSSSSSLASPFVANTASRVGQLLRTSVMQATIWVLLLAIFVMSTSSRGSSYRAATRLTS
jgi:hypothetical protein